MCVAGRGSLDEAVAAMLGQLLEKQGVAARVVPSDAVSTKTYSSSTSRMWIWSAFLIWNQAASQTPAILRGVCGANCRMRKSLLVSGL